MPEIDDDDTEALTWGTERDVTHVEAPEGDQTDVEPDAADVEPEPPATGSALLVAYGAFAALFLVYVVGWVVAIQSIDVSGAGPLALILERVGQFLAFLSPALWFFGVLLIVPSDRARARVLWLLLGIVVLAPWPFILGY